VGRRQRIGAPPVFTNASNLMLTVLLTSFSGVGDELL
jgi:hypothetical protein